MKLRLGFVLVIMFLSFHISWGQDGHIKGRIIDKSSGSPIPFASIAVVDESGQLSGTVSDENGQFKIDKLNHGEYDVVLSFIGYQTTTIESVQINSSQKHARLGLVELETSTIEIEGVEVKGQSKVSSSSIDRKTYKTADFATAKGGNAVDVLNKLPSVSVDPDGTVSVRGTTDFMVYLNGKPTQMEASVLLGQIQSETIESIDVITVPTARYDAQGKGGIINITTRKTGIKGLSLAANGLIGGAPWGNLTDPVSGFKQNDKRYGGGLSFIYHQDALSLYGGANYNRRNVNGMRSGDARILQEDGSFYHMVASGERPEWFINYSANAGMDYQISERSSIAASYYYGNRTEGRSAFYIYNNFYGDKNKQAITGVDPQNEFVYNPNTDDRFGEFHTTNLDYKTRFENKSELSMSFLYEYSKLSRELDNEDYNYDYNAKGIGAKRRHFRQSDQAPLNGYRFSLDYSRELDNGNTIRVGLQPQYLTHDDVFNYDTLNVTTANWNRYESLENAIDLRRGIYAGYVDYEAQWDKLSVIAGLRLEYMDQVMDIANPDYFTIFDRETEGTYTTRQLDWFPTLHMSYGLKEADKLIFAASRRINRPATKNMAPFLYRRHYEVYLVGDPSLEPEYLSNIELTYERYFGNQNISLTGFYRGTDNAVFRVNTIYRNNEIGDLDPDHNKVLVRSYTNAGNTKAYGAELNGNFMVSDKIKFYLGGSLYHYNVNGDVFGYKEDNSSTNWSLKGNFNWMMVDGLKFTTDFDIKSATVTAQGKDELFYMANSALSYAPKKMKGWDFSLRILDILSSNIKGLNTRAFNSDSVEIFYQETEYRRQGPIVEFGINYSLNLNGKTKKAGSTFGKEQF